MWNQWPFHHLERHDNIVFRNKEEAKMSIWSFTCAEDSTKNSSFPGNYLVDTMYVSRDVPVTKSTSTQGIPIDCVTSLLGDLAKMSPTPPTVCTVLIAVAENLWDRVWKQRTTFPLAKVAFKLPMSQPLLQTHHIKKMHTPFWTRGSWQKANGNLYYLALSSSESCETMLSPYTKG